MLRDCRSTASQHVVDKHGAVRPTLCPSQYSSCMSWSPLTASTTVAAPNAIPPAVWMVARKAWYRVAIAEILAHVPSTTDGPSEFKMLEDGCCGS